MQHCVRDALQGAEREAFHPPGITSLMPARLLCGETVVHTSRDARVWEVLTDLFALSPDRVTSRLWEDSGSRLPRLFNQLH